jgi:hypothetical protein
VLTARLALLYNVKSAVAHVSSLAAGIDDSAAPATAVSGAVDDMRSPVASSFLLTDDDGSKLIRSIEDALFYGLKACIALLDHIILAAGFSPLHLLHILRPPVMMSMHAALGSAMSHVCVSLFRASDDVDSCSVGVLYLFVQVISSLVCVHCFTFYRQINLRYL